MAMISGTKKYEVIERKKEKMEPFHKKCMSLKTHYTTPN